MLLKKSQTIMANNDLNTYSYVGTILVPRWEWISPTLGTNKKKTL